MDERLCEAKDERRNREKRRGPQCNEGGTRVDWAGRLFVQKGDARRGKHGRGGNCTERKERRGDGEKERERG